MKYKYYLRDTKSPRKLENFFDFLRFIIILNCPLSLFGLRIHGQGLKAKFLGHFRAEGKSKCFWLRQTVLFNLINNACFLLITAHYFHCTVLYMLNISWYFIIHVVLGCGKTTLLKVMVGKLKLDSGKVRSFYTIINNTIPRTFFFWAKSWSKN